MSQRCGTTSDQRRSKLQSVGQRTFSDWNAQTSFLLHKDDLVRIKDNARVLSKDEKLQKQHEDDLAREMKASHIKERKEKMLKLQNEKHKDIPLNEDERQRLEDQIFARKRVIENNFNNKDHTKAMNKMVDYAKCVTVRDEQIHQKKFMKTINQRTNDKLETLYEVNRLKQIKEYQDDCKRKKDAYKDYLEGLQTQINFNKTKKIQQRQQEVKETDEFLVYAQEMKYQDQLEKHLLKKKKHERNLELYEENQRCARVKHAAQQLLDQDDEKIIQYNKEKIRKENELHEQQLDEKEKENQKFREMQQKAQDKNAEIDALHARRATEMKDRAEREREKKHWEHKIKMEYDVHFERKRQEQYKIQRLEEQAKVEKKEFDKIVDVFNKFQDVTDIKTKEETIEQKNKELRYANVKQIRKQIEEKELQKNQVQRDVLEEGHKLKDDIDQEITKLEQIKKEKLEWYDNAGINKKYTIELARKKINY